MKKIGKQIFHLFLITMYKVFRHFPINKKLIAFESERDFSDNSRALYDYLKDNSKEYKYAWLTHKKESIIFEQRTTVVYHNYSLNSLRDAWILARSKFIFYTHGLGADFVHRSGQIVFNLWHGVPIKGVKGNIREKKLPQFDFLLSLGEMNAPLFAEFLSCDVNYVRPLGYPRNDFLFNCKDDGYRNEFVPSGFNGKVIIWMPTFRKSWSTNVSEDGCDNETGLPLLDDRKALENFNSFLIGVNACVLVKIHHLQADKDVFSCNYSNLIFIRDKDVESKGKQLYQVVAKTDALITDYSSVFVDYFLMDRPIGFILDDIEEYQKGRGNFLYSPVTALLAGEHIYCYDQLKSFCMNVVNNEDISREKRHIVSNMMIKYHDGNSCKRIANYLNLIIEG